MTTAARSVRHRSPEAIEVAEMLRRYPRLEPRENAKLAEAFKGLPLRDVALMTSSESLRPGLDAFRRDQETRIGPQFFYYLMFIGLSLAILVAVVWGLWVTSPGG